MREYTRIALSSKEQIDNQDLVVLVPESDSKSFTNVSSWLKELIEEQLTHSSFSAKSGETAFALHQGKRIVLGGLGDLNALTKAQLRKCYANCLKEARKQGATKLGVFIPNAIQNKFKKYKLIQALAETTYLSLYRYQVFMSERDSKEIEELNLFPFEESENLTSALDRGATLGANALITRDLVNTPAQQCHPEFLAKKATALGKQKGFEVRIIDQESCAALGMDAFLSVGRASNQEPKLIVMKWRGASEDAPTLGLIGKGVTYDTGGLSLKPTGSMLHMKSDMSGSAAVIGAMCSLAELRIEQNVTAVVAACENNVSANAFKPGDVLKSMSGKTIEIRNTDAEGRLTLADAIHYAITKEKVESIIDIATLTGAVKIALGEHMGGVVSTHDYFVQKLKEASSESDEPFWQLPIDAEYRDLNKSQIADISNTGRDGLAGTISAAAFVEAFTQNLPWMHFDVAGVSFTTREQEYLSYGATAFGMRTLVEMIERL